MFHYQLIVIAVVSILISVGPTSIEKPYAYGQEICEIGSNCTDFGPVLPLPSNEGQSSRDVNGAQANSERELSEGQDRTNTGKQHNSNENPIILPFP